MLTKATGYRVQVEELCGNFQRFHLQFHVMLNLIDDDLKAEGILEFENAPRLPRLDLLMASPDQEEIDQKGDTDRFFNPIFRHISSLLLSAIEVNRLSFSESIQQRL